MARGKRVEIVKLTVDGVEVDAKTCTKCGEVKSLDEFSVQSSSPSGRRCSCKECLRRPGAKRISRNRKYTTTTYRDYVRQCANGDYVPLEDFINTTTKIKHKHLVCGHVYLVSPDVFLRGSRCPNCKAKANGERCRKKDAEFIQEVRDATSGEYEVAGRYSGAQSKVKMLHKNCGRIYEVTPTKFLGGNRCPACRSSKGEARIDNFLMTACLNYNRQEKFSDCIDRNHLPFDFVISSQYGKVAIEYDGEQHRQPVDFAGKGSEWAERQLRQTERRDAIKTEYCRANGIPLIRIDYTQFDEIEAVLDRELSALGVTGKRNNTDNNESKRKEDAA